MFVCDECVGLCNDIIDDQEFSRVLQAGEQIFGAANVALGFLRDKFLSAGSRDQLARYLQRRESGAQRWRLELQQVERMLAMPDDEVVAETDVLATPRFAFLRNMTRAGLRDLQQQLTRRLKRFEDVRPVVMAAIGES